MAPPTDDQSPDWSLSILPRWRDGILLELELDEQEDIPRIVIADDGPMHGWPKYTIDLTASPSLGYDIPNTEDRGITPRQLLALWEHVSAQCVTDSWESNFGGKVTMLTPEVVNLYAVNDYVIKPSTKARGCSYVELIAATGMVDVVQCPSGDTLPLSITCVNASLNQWLSGTLVTAP